MTPPSDAQLVQECLAGKTEAFGQIVHRYRGLVSGVTYNRCLGDLAHSEDLAQDAFIAAWRSLPRLNDPSRLSAWLCGIARNVAAAARRSRRVETTAVPLSAVGEVASTESGPDQTALNREQQQLLWTALERIPDRYRQVLILYYRQQQSTIEVAAALEIPEATVRKRLERGRALLRSELAQFVEEALQDSMPGTMFTAAVLAVLPGIALPSVASAGVVGAKAVKTAGLLASSGWLLGPALGFVGALIGWLASVRNARSPRHRRLMVRGGAAILLFVIGFPIALLAVQVWARPRLTLDGYLVAQIAAWMIYLVLLGGAIAWMTWREQKILAEDGVLDAVHRHLALEKSWSRPSNVIGAIAGSVYGSTAWLAMYALRAEDYWSAVMVLIVSTMLTVAAVRRILRNPHNVRSTLLAIVAAIIVLTAAMVNLRLTDWVAAERGQPLDIPLWAVNLLLVVLWAGISGILLLSLKQSNEQT